MTSGLQLYEKETSGPEAMPRAERRVSRPALRMPRLRWPVVGLRWRLVLLVVIAVAPAILLFLHHSATQRTELILGAQSRALHLARVWADNHDAVLRDRKSTRLNSSHQIISYAVFCLKKKKKKNYKC